MEGYWTFADKDKAWEHEPFETKEEAINEGRKAYPLGFYIGQIEKSDLRPYKYVVTVRTTEWVK